MNRHERNRNALVGGSLFLWKNTWSDNYNQNLERFSFFLKLTLIRRCNLVTRTSFTHPPSDHTHLFHALIKCSRVTVMFLHAHCYWYSLTIFFVWAIFKISFTHDNKSNFFDIFLKTKINNLPVTVNNKKRKTWYLNFNKI